MMNDKDQGEADKIISLLFLLADGKRKSYYRMKQEVLAEIARIRAEERQRAAEKAIAWVEKMAGEPWADVTKKALRSAILADDKEKV